MDSGREETKAIWTCGINYRGYVFIHRPHTQSWLPSCDREPADNKSGYSAGCDGLPWKYSIDTTEWDRKYQLDNKASELHPLFLVRHAPESTCDKPVIMKKSLVIISDCLAHTAESVFVFTCKLIAHNKTIPVHVKSELFRGSRITAVCNANMHLAISSS